MSKANDQAFPRPGFDGPGLCFVGTPGLTKRELFAAMAMQGMIASENDSEVLTDELWLHHVERTVGSSIDYADELLKQLG